MKRACAIFCVIIFLFGCDKNNSRFSSGTDKKEKLADEISFRIAEQLYTEKGLQPCGFGGGTMDKVRELVLCFFCYKRIDIDEARELLMSAGNMFLDAINEDERIRPYLINYPFLPKNIGIEIYFKELNGSNIKEPGKLHVAWLMNGLLTYDDENLETKRLQTIHKETFEEAIEILKESEKHKAVVRPFAKNKVIFDKKAA
ncbi:MAG TPA: hypothetical protein VGJ00_06250 [Rhabdochlamydiaceae bacterium]|jgi:hypothetical protein